MRLHTLLLDLLYPARCASCGAAHEWWCLACRSSVEHLPVDPCARCLSVERGHDADACVGTLPFTRVVSTGFYHSPPLRRMIAALKYDGVTAAGSSVEEYLQDALAQRSMPLPWAGEADLVIVPMPLADARERERGFNQAVWMAERLTTVTSPSSPIAANLVVRRKGKYAQADLEHDVALRHANVTGQFQMVARIDHPILLVDDVVTTGSTAAEVARALIAAGAPRIYLFTVAVGK